MKRHGLIILSCILLFESFAQENAVITGKIIDAETEKPLAFATVNIQNTAKGVVANEDGVFEFKFPKSHLKDTLNFSMSGYTSEKLLIQSLPKSSSLTVELVSQEVMLAEVVVTEKKLTAEDILSLALENIKNNYPTKHFEFKAFYRDYKQEDGECISIFEPAISVFDKGYSKVSNKYALKEKVVLDQVRKSVSVNYQTHAFKRINVIKPKLSNRIF